MPTNIVTAYLLTRCEHGHETATQVINPSLDDDGVLMGLTSSDAHFCSICDTVEMTPVAVMVNGETYQI